MCEQRHLCGVRVRDLGLLDALRAVDFDATLFLYIELLLVLRRGTIPTSVTLTAAFVAAGRVIGSGGAKGEGEAEAEAKADRDTPAPTLPPPASAGAAAGAATSAAATTVLVVAPCVAAVPTESTRASAPVWKSSIRALSERAGTSCSSIALPFFGEVFSLANQPSMALRS